MTDTKPENKMNAFKVWMEAASPEQQQRLADHLGTTRPVLYHYSSKFYQMSPERARKVEGFTIALHKETKGELPKVYRTDLNGACRECEFAAKCLGEAAVVSEFEFLPKE